MKVAVVGGGASGFFSAITVKKKFPDADVVIFEKSEKLLAKVKISGGGRCNVTNACPSNKELLKAYPRGQNFLKKAFRIFNNKDAVHWFESRNVPLVTQADDCVFPASQNSQSIINCFLENAQRSGIRIETGRGVSSIRQKKDDWVLEFMDDTTASKTFNKVIVATGGSPKRKNLAWLERLGHEIEEPVPSLFTFNMPNEPITNLMGVVVEKTIVSIQGSNFKADGPLLVTHWGMSGPAILKLSAFGARSLYEKNYEFRIQVNWTNEKKQDGVKEKLNHIARFNAKKILSSVRPFSLPDRLWRYLIEKSELSSGKKWGELGKKGINKLTYLLVNDVYRIQSKTSFRDEFVTCGGISLKNVDPMTMQSRVCRNLYFAGEILDIDGITGGFNFQAAWTTGFIAGHLK